MEVLKYKRGYKAAGICARCLEPKELRKNRPHWCIECYKAYQRNYFKQYNHTDIAKYHREVYKKTEKGKIAKKNGKYVRRQRSNTGSIKANEWRSLCETYNHRCVRCGQLKPLTIDHIIPLSKGGLNTIDNIQPLCMECNTIKGTDCTDYR